jgi:phage/plasmid-like protein (TIGR03299 family)
MRTSTFASIGTDISACKTSEEVLNAAGLNYNVIKKGIKYLGPDGETYYDYPDKVLTVNESTGFVYNAVSSKYEICQNRDAFNFIDYIGNDNEGFQYVKAGEISNGSTKGLVYIIAKIPDITLLGDAITPYIIFQNSHDGMNSVKATISPLRIVCQNQFNLAFREASNTVRIVHSSKMDTRLVTARNMMHDVATYMSTFEDTAEELAKKKISQDQIIKIFNEVFKYDPEKMTNRQVTNFEMNRAEFLSCYKSDDNQNFNGTAWGVINGAADYLTHHVSQRKPTADAMFVNTTLLSVALNQIFNRVVAV